MPKIEKDLLKVKGSDGQWHYVPAVGGEGGSTPTWHAVQNKPFESLGDGLSVENGVLSAKGGGGSANAVQYVAQELTDEQKAQARENIGAGTSSFSGSYNDLTSKPTIPTQVTIDSTLKQSGQAADAKAVGDALQHFTPTEALNSEFREIELTFATKLDKNQGTTNAGKILGIGEDGNVVPQDKPTYTAEEVGALPNTTVIPTVPVTLPNPQKLTFTGAVTGEYDGSTALTVDIPQGGDSLVIPEQRIALDNAMLVGSVTHVGTVLETTTEYKHTEKIKLNSHKSFQLTGKDANGVAKHIALRYVTAYDADGKVISAYSLQNVAEASASAGRVVQMDAAVDSVIVSIYKPEQYTDKTFILPSVVRDIASALAEKITAPTTAAVGQIIKVKSVDESGKPTEWEAADLDKDEYVVLVNTTFAENKLNTDMWLDETLYATTHVWRSATPLDLICMCIYVPTQTENIITSGELKVGVLSDDKDSNYWDLPPEAPYFGFASFVYTNGQNRWRKFIFDLRSRTAEVEVGNNITRNQASATSIACMPQFGKYYAQSAYLQAISIRLIEGSLPAGTELFVYGRKNNGNRIKHPGWSIT